MATSLLRLGRLGSLKCLQQDGWGSLRTPLTAAFCTKAEKPKKAAKKASSKTLEASDERAALLAYKTTVAFPTRLSTPGFLSQGVALGEYEQSGNPVTGESAVAAGAASAGPTLSTPQVSAESLTEENVTTADAKRAESVDSAKAEPESCDLGAAAEATPIAETATERDATSPTSADVEESKSEVALKDDDDATSSSSSSSDSDSDSDSDDEKPDKTEMTEPVVQTEDKAGQEEMPSGVSKEPASDVKTGAVPKRIQPSVPEVAPEVAPVVAPEVAPEVAPDDVPEVAEAVSEPRSEEVPAPSTAAASSEEIVDPAPVLRTAESIKAQEEVILEKEAGVDVKSSKVSEAIPEPVTEGAPDVAAEPTPEVILDPATKVASKPEVEIKAAPETTEAVAAAEELVDPAPVITDAEEVRAEPEVAAAPEEAAAAPAPEPEPEPFDNTTYKNLQHHSYNMYTFVDMDVEMAKHRLPQPSTGRPSPRH
ncbi:hypothetical protein PGIGA_G00219020 [Pangasianodon gigas]|uniref:Uncharacterized protein n=1 Tax=Pangasianodon gigas TaxID=30993 RepID=A0ACC5WJ88_PANGG|nr:hypothetical protein [Pangasianodon gigas]